MVMPNVLCVVCGELATCLVRKDYDIKHGGMSVCARCKPTRGVWVLEYDAPGQPRISGSVVNPVPRTKGRLLKK